MMNPTCRDRRALARAALSLLLTLAACSGSDGSTPQADATDASDEESAPRLSGMQVAKPGTHDGFTLIGPLNSTTVYLVDMDGEVAHSWETDHAPGAAVYMLDNGNLLRCGFVDGLPGFHGGGIGGSIKEIDWDGNVVWEYELANDALRQHHDIEPLPNGNVLLIAWELKTESEAIARGRDPTHVGEQGLWPDAVLEIRPLRPSGAEVVWEWHAWDHLVQDRDPGLADFGSPRERPGRIDINADHRFETEEESDEEREQREALADQMAELGYAGGTPAVAARDTTDDPDGTDDDAEPPESLSGDWLHTNSVEWLPEHDLILLSSPRLSEIFIIDHSTTTAEAATDRGGRWRRGGDLLWRWGNPRNHGIGDATYRQLYYQHHPNWVTDGELPSVLVFNNGGGRPDGSWSSVLELDLPWDFAVGGAQGFTIERGRPYGPPRPSWSYEDRDTFLSEFISGAERLPNGNTLICSGKNGRVFEVSPTGEILWDWWSPLGGDIEPNEQGGKSPPNALFRATRIAPDHPGLAGRL